MFLRRKGNPLRRAGGTGIRSQQVMQDAEPDPYQKLLVIRDLRKTHFSLKNHSEEKWWRYNPRLRKYPKLPDLL